MGVQGLWRVLEPTAKPVQLGNLRGKVLAIDASIWIYHFLKAMRDSKGTILAAAHIIGFFRRICKLLFFEIRPVFVFDGAAPLLKKQTTQKRGERRQGREVNARATANKLLTLQLQRAAQQESQPQASDTLEVRGTVPADAVYMDQVVQPAGGAAAASRESGPVNFVRMDQYHLPELSKIAPVNSNDQRMLSEEELQEYSRTFTEQARAGFIDTSTVDFHSPEFQRLPIETQYQLLNMARLKSRLRMGYTAEELDQMFPNEMDFSRFQINRVAQRNFFTQRLMNLVGLEEDLTRRVSSEKNKEYMLKRNEEGWTLSLEDSTKGADATAAAPASANMADEVKEELSDDEFEDVDIEPTEQAPEPSVAAAAAEPAREQDLDISAEDSARLDELFGFEAKLSREDLYNKLMQEVGEESEEAPAKESKPKDWKPRSFLFGSSSSKSEVAPKRGYPPDSHKQPPRAAASQEPAEAAQTQGTEKHASSSLPWFERSGDNFEEMRIQSRNTDPHLVPYEELRDLSETDDEEPFEEVDLSKENLAEQNTAEQNTSPTQEPRSAEPVALAGPPTHTQEPPEMTESIGSSKPADDAEPSIPSHAHEHYESLRSVSPQPSIPTEFENPAVANASADIGELPLSPVATQPLRSPDATHPDAFADPAKTDVALESAAELVPRERVSEPAAQSEPDQLADSPEAALAAEAAAATAGQSEPVAFSPEAAERAEEEAKAAVDEDDEIAAMLIAEAEENERFAKELAEQNHKAWTEADQLDYNAQISTLRNQFAKETRDADNVTQEMVQECQELLQFFGIPYITAPGEAEAQCAELRHLKLVDGVVTDDGDTFLFDDDTVVYRNMFSQSRFVECYTTRQIREKLGLDRRRLIDLAFLLGSDYTEGVLGIGPVTGVEILAEFGSLEEFANWWNEAQRFPDSAGLETRLRRRLFKQFRTKLFLPEEFPSKTVVEAYLHPAVDKDATKFNWGVPDIDGLRKFMSVTAGWSMEKINTALLPVVQEAKRRELQNKAGAALSQSRLDDYYSTVVQNPEHQSKRAAKATSALRKRVKK